MALLNKLFGKSKKSSPAKTFGDKKEEKKDVKIEIKKPVSSRGEEKAKLPAVLKSEILLSGITTEKAMSGQSLNHYVFKVAPLANKIEIAKAVNSAYNVKAVSINIINIPRKARRVGKTSGFKSGYKKAIVTLAKGQSIEIK